MPLTEYIHMTISSSPQTIVSSLQKFEIGEGISLLWREAGNLLSGYPTDLMQKGLLLSSGDKVLDEEGTGFGVPIIKMRHETILPGNARLVNSLENGVRTLMATYTLNLVKKKIIKGKYINNQSFYRLNEGFASIHRNVPMLRRIHSWLSHRLRDLGDIESILETANSSFTINVLYSFFPHDSILRINADLSTLPPDESIKLIMTNEQGSSYFSNYRDSNGLTLADKGIGTWNQVLANEASFIDSKNNITFTLKKKPGVKMFRGREDESGQLAWSGIAYEIPRKTLNFEYDITLGAFK
jgi:hypothetical protein